MNNTTPELPVEVVECINNWIVTFALAYHRRKDKDISNDAAEFITDELSMPNALTTYATKLFTAEQEIESLTNQLKKQNEVQVESLKLLRQENEKLKEQATGWRPLLEQILREDDNNISYISADLLNKIKRFLYGE
jgi:hypothetical protein